MKVGIISDTHDNLINLKKFLNIFQEEKVKLILHAGDIISGFCVRALSKTKIETYAVFGNNDGDKLMLKEIFSSFGKISLAPFIFEVERKKIVLLHEGDYVEFFDLSKKFDLIVYGHSHELFIEKRNSLIINPGEAGGWLKNEASAVILELEDLTYKIIKL